MTDDMQTERETLMAARLDAARARHAEPVPAAVAVGQWRKLFSGEPFRVGVAAKIGPTEGHDVRFLNQQIGWWNDKSMSSLPFASPKDALDAKLVTLTPEQRARVTTREESMGLTLLVDDRDVLWRGGIWWCRGVGMPDVNVDADIDRMLAAIDRALAAPKPQTRADDYKWTRLPDEVAPKTRTEAIRERYRDEPRVTWRDVGETAQEAMVGGIIVASWSSCHDADHNLGQTAESIIARIDAALAKPAAESAVHIHAFIVQADGTSRCGCGDRLPDEPAPQESTAPEGGAFVDPCVCCGNTPCSDTEENRIRHAVSLALDEVTKLRRQHAELGGAIERLTELLGGEVARD